MLFRSDIRAFVVGSQVVASMKRQSLDDDFRSNLHKGGLGEIVKLTPDERKNVRQSRQGDGLDGGRRRFYALGARCIGAGGER